MSASSLPPAAGPPPAPKSRWPRRVLWSGGLGAAALVGLFFAWGWWGDRLGHSATDDAFVEAHIVNVAPQQVSGRIVRFLVEENDRVETGQELAVIDPVPYRDQVRLAEAKLKRAELALVR